jgi:hypothetical protein
MVERCFHALDTRRIRFNDTEEVCPVASASAAVPAVVGICLLSQPHLAVGAVAIIGAVAVAVAIKEELEAYALRRHYPEEETTRAEAKPATQFPLAERRPKPKASPSGQDRPPPVPAEPLDRERYPDCVPRPVPHLGGNALHNRCADGVPRNGFPGSDVIVNGKRFDALQPRERVLWEVKTTAIETYNPYVRRVELDKQIEEARRERDLAAACVYDFRVGVRSEAHKELLERAAPDLEGIVVLMDWC